MRKSLFFIPLSLAALTGCALTETFDALERNRQAVEWSTCTIEENRQAIEEANRAIDENRREIEGINQALKEAK